MQNRRTLAAIVIAATAVVAPASAQTLLQPPLPGKGVWLEGTYTNWLEDTHIKAVVFNFHDITERVESEEKIKSLNRFYNFTSRINQMMIHARDEDTVYQEVCSIATEVGKFRMAWIGVIDKEKNVVTPVSFSGHNDDYISRGKIISLEDITVSKGPTATAIRSGRYFYFNDIEHDEAMRPWARSAVA